MLSVTMVSRRSLMAAALGLAFVAPAAAQAVTVTDITRETGSHSTLTVPTVELTDASIGEAEVRALFAADNVATVGETLAGLDAAAIVIPEMTIEGGEVEADGDDTRGTVTLTNVRLANVEDGVAGEVSIEGGSVELNNGVKVALGTVTLTDLDMGYLFALGGIGDTSALAARELLPVWSSLSIGASSFESEDGTCSVEGFEGGAVAVRQPQHTNFGELFALMGKAEETREAAMEARGDDAVALRTQALDEAALLQMHYYDVLTSYAADEARLAGVECNVVNDQDDPIAFGIDEVFSGPASPGNLAEVIATGLSIENSGKDAGTMSIELMHVLPGEYADVAAAFAEIGTAIDGKWLEENQRRVIPSFGGFEIGGVTMDLPNSSGTAPAGARIVGSIGTFGVMLSNYLNGIPTSVHSSATDLVFELPKDESGQMLAALGLDPLQLSYDVAADWNEETEEVTISNVGLYAAGGGTVMISGVIGSVKPELFALDARAAMTASRDLTLKELRIHLADEGLLEKGLAMVAAQQNVTPEQFRAAMAGMSQGMVLMSLGGTPDSIKVAGAINRFISEGGELSLTATSIDPAGVSLVEMQQKGDPTQVLKLFTITVEETAAMEAPAPEAPAAEAPAAKEKTK